jgi:hypothetical protein
VSTVIYCNEQLFEVGWPTKWEGKQMPIDKETQVSASIVLDKVVYEKLKVIAKKHKRSISSQVAFWIEEQLRLEEGRENQE